MMILVQCMLSSSDVARYDFKCAQRPICWAHLRLVMKSPFLLYFLFPVFSVLLSKSPFLVGCKLDEMKEMERHK